MSAPFSDEEQKRRDEILRRVLQTPPQPRGKPGKVAPKGNSPKAKKAASAKRRAPSASRS